MIKKIAQYISKCIISAVIALVILSIFSLIYFNQPVSAVQPDGITNYKFESNRRWSYMKEGFGYGLINDTGYNSSYFNNYTNPDIVVLGSSHTEAMHVPENANYVYLLNEKLDTDDLQNNDFQCLNLGVSGHFFETSATHFEAVADKFDGVKYIVIETFDVEFSPSELDKILNNEYHSPSEERGTLYKAAQKVPYFRLLNMKLDEIRKPEATNSDLSAEENSDNSENIEIYEEKMNIILGEISAVSKEHGIKPVILLHNKISKNENGNMDSEANQAYINSFKKCCSENGIEIVDVVPSFISHYNETYELPYGFSNTVPGQGHLNVVGHNIISEELYKKINQMIEVSK